MSGGVQLRRPLFDVRCRAIDEDERRPEVRERSRDDLADLPFSAYAGQYDGRTGIHESGIAGESRGAEPLSMRITMACRPRPH